MENHYQNAGLSNNNIKNLHLLSLPSSFKGSDEFSEVLIMSLLGEGIRGVAVPQDHWTKKQLVFSLRIVHSLKHREEGSFGWG